ncbi:MAG TPA: alpha/beta hydrolase [Dehalococcoidia bacterium]|nr:alpha/beta hydrolase [Dehalococcoidia bacterium]
MPDATINGFKHHWEEAGPSTGSGEVLVMLHGAAASGKLLAPHLPELAKSLRVIIPDIRGMGQSQRVSSITPNAWEDDLGSLLDHLGIQKAHLFGTSLGSRICLRFTIDNPGRVLSLILDNPLVANNPAMDARFVTPPPATPEQARRNEMMHGPDWELAIQNYYAIRNDQAFQSHHNFREVPKNAMPAVPTLITRGDSRRDLVHPLPDAFEMFNLIETSRLWIKPEGGCLATPEGYDRIRTHVAAAAASK